MPWVETHSLSFTARHDSGDSAFAERTLDRMEDLRLRLEDRFEAVPGDVTVVVHTNPGLLAMAHPFLPAARWSAAPAGRRYLAGWAMATELHVLNDPHMERRAAGDDSREALRGNRRAALRAARRRRQQPGPAPLLDAAPLRPLPRLGLAGRGRGPVLRPPSRPLPRRGDPPAARERPAVLPSVAPRRGPARRNDLRPARERAGYGGLRGPRPPPASRRGAPTLEAAFDARAGEIEAAWRDYLRETARPACRRRRAG